MTGAEINQAKIVLADAATAMAHGEEAAAHASETAKQTFEQGGAGEDLPTLHVPEGQIPIVAALVGLGFAASNGEARRKIAEGAVRLDGEVIDDPAFVVTLDGDEP